MAKLQSDLNDWRNRRTFAIIAHPDAGKTTLTERLLLASGAVREAGEVKARGERRRARSDWMEMEQSRGISVTSSVMTFTRGDIVFNLLDTPGHEDFSEDTYRTLTAVDSAIMVIDAARGIESQTLKLLEVCRLRDIPIITFINKVDREGRDPLSLLDELEETLALDLSPVTWPVGMGGRFQGLYDIPNDTLLLGGETDRHHFSREVPMADAKARGLETYMDTLVWDEAAQQIELANEVYPRIDVNSYREGHLSPVVFGSALKDFGMQPLLNLLDSVAPPPRAQPAEPHSVDPGEDRVTGFVFKVQANMDPNHRDRIAFTRVCSGTFDRNMKLTNQRTGKALSVRNPIFFFAQERTTAEQAVPGDIVGIPNHGTLRVGDTLAEGAAVRFTGIPDFAPEILRRVVLVDPVKSKQMRKGLDDLAEEGVVQVFAPLIGAQPLVGAVGQLQLDVLQSRLPAEYGVDIRFEDAGVAAVRWVTGDKQPMADLMAVERFNMATDIDGAHVLFARSDWVLNSLMEKHPKISFLKTKERGGS